MLSLFKLSSTHAIRDFIINQLSSNVEMLLLDTTNKAERHARDELKQYLTAIATAIGKKLAETDKPEEILDAFQQHPGFEQESNSYGYTLLTFIAWNKDIELVEKLLELGADPNGGSCYKNGNGNLLALIIAKGFDKQTDEADKCSYYTIAKLLIESGAELNQIDPYFYSLGNSILDELLSENGIDNMEEFEQALKSNRFAPELKQLVQTLIVYEAPCPSWLDKDEILASLEQPTVKHINFQLL